MSRLWARFAGLFRSRAFVAMDKTGNRYFARTEQIDGVMKEKRWVVFKGEQDPTSIPVEWTCWLNGQRKKAPTPEEMAELEARRERVKMNVALLRKKEDDERKGKGGKAAIMSIGKSDVPDLKSFIEQFPTDSEVRAPKNLRNVKKFQKTSENRESPRSRLVLVNLSDLGHGNRQHDSRLAPIFADIV